MDSPACKRYLTGLNGSLETTRKRYNVTWKHHPLHFVVPRNRRPLRLIAGINRLMTTLEIDVKAVDKLSLGSANLIRRRNDREFGNDPLVYADPEWYILGFRRGELITHVGVLRRIITVGQISLPVAGVCYLITEPENRNQGLASAVMREAVTFLKNELGQAFGLLTCRSRLESFYARTGWRTVAGPTIFAQPDGIRCCGGLTMVNECRGIPWPEGEINLGGLPW
jgi:predicted GNAT family N-acyltransferase